MRLSKQANSEITLPFLLGIILSVTVLVLILSKLGAVSSFFSGASGGSNFNDVVTRIEEFTNPRLRGDFVTKRYLLTIEEDDAMFGINEDARYAEFSVTRYQGSFENRDTVDENVYRFFRPSSCSSSTTCLCFCDSVTYPSQGDIYEITCEQTICQELNSTQFGDNTYLKKYSSNQFLEMRNTDGVHLSILDFGIEGTNVGYTPEGVRLVETPNDNSFVLQWVDEDTTVIVCDYFNNWLGGVCTELS